MRLKQQSFIDQYIEKIILGVAVLIGLAIAYFYILGTPYSLELSPGKTVTPSQVEQDYMNKAQQLKVAVETKALPEALEKLQIPDYESRFRDRYLQNLLKADSFYAIAFGPPGTIGVGEKPISIVLNPVDVAPLPAKALTASASNHVLAPDSELQITYSDTAGVQYPEQPDVALARAGEWTKKAASLTGDHDPRDFWNVSIVGTIDMQAWVDAQAAVPAEQRMPPTWYEDLAQFIAGIKVERQTLDPKTGIWSNDTVINPLPGSVTEILNEYIKQVQAAKKDPKVLDDESALLQQALVENLRYYLEDLAKPQFLPVKAHRPWLAPDQIIPELSPEDQQALLKINQQINKYESELRALVGRANTGAGTGATKNNVPPRITNPYDEGLYAVDPRAPRGSTPRGNVPAPKTLPGVKGKQPGPGTDPSKKANPTADRIALYESRLADLYKQKDEILFKLIKEDPADPSDPSRLDPTRPRVTPGRPPTDFREGDILPQYRERPGLPGQPRRPNQPQIPGRPGVVDPNAEFKLPPIKFWAHDPTVEPGKTYQYRVTYQIINPLFAKEDQLVEGQKAKADELILDSAPSAWTEPVTIESPLRYFVEDVNPQTSTVTWGVYRIHNGYRIHKQFITRPGDPIGKVVEVDVKDDQGAVAGKMDVDLRVPVILVDVKAPSKQAGVINAKGPTTVLIADMELGNVMMRDAKADQENDDRVRLFNDATGAAAGPVATTPARPGTPGVSPEFFRPIPTPPPPAR